MNSRASKQEGQDIDPGTDSSLPSRPRPAVTRPGWRGIRLFRRHRLPILWLLLTTTVTTAAAASTPVTIYADGSYPPYSWQENGEVRGLYTRILRTAFSRMPDYEVEIRAVPWKRGLKLLESGSGFALYPPYFRLRQRPWIWPYSLPIADEQVVVFCREGVLNEAQLKNWPEGYYGLRIGINAGFQLGGDQFWQAVEAGQIRVQEAGGNRENLTILGVGRTDCYMNDRLSILMELKRLKSQGKYHEGSKHARLIEGATVTREQGFLGYTSRDRGRFSFKADFKKQLDSQLYQMRRSGELQRIIDDFID